ncbi:MAG: metalloregulator ArsR/SmtB family transcription factor [Planctomycetota bacterium]
MSSATDDLVFKALADASRRRLLDLMRATPSTTSELADQFATSRFAVMKHLQVLVDAGLVLVERRGRERINTLNPVPIQQIHCRWLRQFEAAGADRLLDLASHVERPSTKQRKVARA